jgi:hypothetical protein
MATEQTTATTSSDASPSGAAAENGGKGEGIGGKGKGNGRDGQKNRKQTNNNNRRGGGKGGKSQSNNVDEGEAVCIVCADDIDHRTLFSVLAPCGHNDICSLCALRLRVLHNDKRCPCCNIEADKMIVTSSRKLTWSEVEFDTENYRSAKWAGGNLQLHNESNLYMAHQFKVTHVDRLMSCNCNEMMVSKVPIVEPSSAVPTAAPMTTATSEEAVGGMPPPPPPPAAEASKQVKTKTVRSKCSANFGNAKALGKHLREKHNLQFCQICVDHKPVFCSELKRYSTNNDELEKHITVGDPKGEGFSGHPKVTTTRVSLSLTLCVFFSIFKYCMIFCMLYTL